MWSGWDCSSSSTGSSSIVRVSYLELRNAPLTPTHHAGAERIALERLDPDEYLALYRRVGAQVRWDQRLQLPRPELDALLTGDRLHTHVLREPTGEAIGLAEFDGAGGPEIELTNFGLIPAAQGRGLGQWLLAVALHSEWCAVTARIWLHTDNWDHPAAMALYLRAGFQVYDQRDEPAGPL